MSYKTIKEMTNDEFVNHLMTGYNPYGFLVQSVIIECLGIGLDHYISQKEEILKQYNTPREDGKISLINMKAWVECCEETKRRIDEKYSSDND